MARLQSAYSGNARLVEPLNYVIPLRATCGRQHVAPVASEITPNNAAPFAKHGAALLREIRMDKTTEQ